MSAHPADTAARLDAAPPQSPTTDPAAVVDTVAAGLAIERAEQQDRTTQLFCAIAARHVAHRWAEEQHQKTERGRVAARPR